MTILISFLIVCAFFGAFALFVWAIESDSKWADRMLWVFSVALGLAVLLALTLSVNEIFFSSVRSVE